MGIDNIYRWMGWILVLSGLGISWIFRRRAEQSGEEISPQDKGQLLLTLRRIFGIGMWLSVLVFLINPRWMAWGQVLAPAWLRWATVGVMVLCISLLYWLFSSLGNNVTTTVAIRHEHTLVTSGPYRWIRHPLYTFGFLFFIAFSVMAANWFMLIVMLVSFAVIMARTPIEEQKLEETFGDQYRTYMQRTGRYLPCVGGFKKDA